MTKIGTVIFVAILPPIVVLAVLGAMRRDALLLFIALGLIAFAAAGVKMVRPTTRGLVERLGKFHQFAQPGFHFVVPLLEAMYPVNVTEQMTRAQPQVIITKDNLNARVDAVVFFKVKPTENEVKASVYNVYDVNSQISVLARTTLRNIIGTLTLEEANSERDRINNRLLATLRTETDAWGIEVVRTELLEIDPPEDVQQTMNKVVIAKNEKIAAEDFATAVARKADGERRAAVQRADGEREAKILKAQGEAEAIRLVNESAQKYFVDNAQLLKRLEVVADSLRNNTTIIVPQGSDLVNVIGDFAGAPVMVPRKPANGKE